MSKPWLKISFDAGLPGMASISRYPRKRRLQVPGQWVVFDKTQGVGGLKAYAPGLALFSASSMEACHDFIEEQRK